MKRMNESYGIGMHGQFIREKAGWGPSFTSFPEDAKKFSSPKAAQKYIQDNELEDMGVSVVSLPLADDLDESRLNRIVAESVKGVIKEYTNPTTDGAIYPQNREADIKRDAYRLLGTFKGDEKHRQSVTDAQKTNDKYRRYDAWSEKDGLNHGAPFYVPLLKAMNDAKKSLNDEFGAAIDRNPNTTAEEKDFIYDKWRQAMDGLEKSFYEIRNYYRERGVVSDYRGR